MNKIYITFIINKFSVLSKSEYLFFVLICVLFLSLITSFILGIKFKRKILLEKKKLLKKEKLLISLRNSFENGQINAIEYKRRIINLKESNNT